MVPYGYSLIWSDEFEGSSIDWQKWNHEINTDGGGNNELQAYVDHPANSFVTNSRLILEARQEWHQDRHFTSARLNTLGKFAFEYGYVEVKARLPRGQGIWPAIWMLPADNLYGGWPCSGEIDIMEMIGHEPNRVYGAVNFGDPWPNHRYLSDSYCLEQGEFCHNEHVFSLLWEPGIIQWFVDGKLFITRAATELGEGANGPYPWRFDGRFSLVLNVAVGGDWPGAPNETTEFPQRMEIDYVRVYQRSRN